MKKRAVVVAMMVLGFLHCSGAREDAPGKAGACPESAAAEMRFFSGSCVADDGCAAGCSGEARCVESLPSGVDPGPPPTCTDERCAKQSANTICVAGECVLGCPSRPCPASNTCGVDGRCVPASCSGEDDCAASSACVQGRCVYPPCVDGVGPAPPHRITCGTNTQCVDGACVQRQCASHAECCGYCIQGRCYVKPWSCDSGEPPP